MSEIDLTCCGLCCKTCDYHEKTQCKGCQTSDGEPFHGECATAKCCLARGLNHCGECADFPCSLVEANAFDPEHGEGAAMLLKLAKAAGKPILGNRVMVQVGILVHDVDKACEAWAQLLGVEVPKTFWSDGYDKTQATYNGEPCNARCKQGFFQLGPVQFELIQPDENPSVWRDCLDANGEGLHHIAFEIKNMPQKIKILESMGYPLMQKGEYTGGRYAYADARKELKMILELLEND